MNRSETSEAFQVLEQLDQVKGQARNLRLQILTEHQDNKVLKTIFSLATDWRSDLGLNVTGISSCPSDTTLPIDESWSMFLDLLSEVEQRSGLIGNRKKMMRFLEVCHPLVAKWSLRIVNRDLAIYLSTKMLAKIWGNAVGVPFQVPSSSTIMMNGVRTFIFVRHGRPVTYTEGFRKFNTANDCFGKQIARSCSDGVVEGWVTSSDWPLTQSLLSHHASTLSKAGFKSLYYSLQFELINFYHNEDFEKAQYIPDNKYLFAILKSLNPRSSIRLSPDVVGREGRAI
jgi:hypothetical protein